MENNEIKRILISKGVHRLYHVNTVVTACTYLSQGGLLSRAETERRHLPQTKQKSDTIDKFLGIYNDIFFDSVDIHQHAQIMNNYGAVTFVFDVGVLDEAKDAPVKITKSNPINWGLLGNPSEEGYFNDPDSLMQDFKATSFDQHITIHNISGCLPFAEHLKDIILDDADDPTHPEFLQAQKVLSAKIQALHLGISLTIRKCPEACDCHRKYRETKPGFRYYRFRTHL